MKLAANIALLLLLTACTSDSVTTIEQAMQHVNCESQSRPPAFMVNGSYTDCTEQTNLYWFDDKKAKTNHIKLCALADNLPVKSGDLWVQYQPKCFAF